MAPPRLHIVLGVGGGIAAYKVASLLRLLTEAGQIIGTWQYMSPEQFLQFINPSELIRRFAASDGIDIAGLAKSEQDIQSAMAQQQQVQLAQQLTQGAVDNGLTSAQPAQPVPAPAAGGANGGPAPVQPAPV